MQSLYAESRMIDLSPICQQFCQQERVFATREPHKDAIIILYQMISSHRLDEPFFQTMLQATALIIQIRLLHADAYPCSMQRDDHRP